MAGTGIGRFEFYKARRSQKGPPIITSSGTTATDVWTVVLPEGKHPLESGVTVTDVPKIGDKWDINDKFEVTQVRWANTFPSETWTASVEYRKVTKSGDKPDPGTGVKVQKIDYEPMQWTKDLEFDMGNLLPVQNLIGDRFQDALRTQLYTTSIIIHTLEKTVKTAELEQNQGTINAGTVTIGGITMNACTGLATIAYSETDNEEYPYSVTRTIRVAHNRLGGQGAGKDYIVTGFGTKTEVPSGGFDLGWRSALLHTGYRYYRTVDTQTFVDRFLDKDATGADIPAVDPHLLNEKGEPVLDPSVERYWMVFCGHPVSNWPTWWGNL